MDRVRAEAVLERKPVLSWLPMGSPEAGLQIISGVYRQEGNTRWMSGRAVLLLKKPNEPNSVSVDLYIPDKAPVRSVRLLLDGAEIANRTLPRAGELYTVSSGPVLGSMLAIELDRTFSVPGDNRELGAVLVAAGFR